MLTSIFTPRASAPWPTVENSASVEQSSKTSSGPDSSTGLFWKFNPAQFPRQLFQTALIGLFIASLVSALHPGLRSAVRGTFAKDYRSVLSSVHGDLLGNGTDYTIVKVKTRDNLFLEIYDSVKNGSSHLVSRIDIADKKDGFFSFNGQATNLALDDIDGDGKLEIIVPSFDQNLVGHLNLYRYNQDVKGLQRVIE
jgi:hypothetical protein